MLLPAKLPQCPLSQLETPATLGDGGKGRDAAPRNVFHTGNKMIFDILTAFLHFYNGKI
jgi:hypothetical protein